GNYEIIPALTTIPGYHAVIAFIANAFDISSLKQIRVVSLLLSSISIWIFYLIEKRIDNNNSYTKTLQYVFLPLTFFYFPFVYTDIFSLLLVLVSFYFALSKKYTRSALFALISLAVRQTNIVWVPFFWLYTYIMENGLLISAGNIRNHIRKGAGYVVVAVIFLLFVYLNDGVAIGDRNMQQVGFHSGNVYLFLALVGILFLPISIDAMRKVDIAFFKSRVAAGIVMGAVTIISFLLFKPAVHAYNQDPLFLRNIALVLAYGKYVWVYLFAIFWGCITLFLMKFDGKSLLMFPFIFALLIPSLLVEQRYLIIPMVLILLFRKKNNTGIEYLNAAYFGLLSLALVWMIFKMNMFF
ncbi:MAG: hypothetical protein PHW24_05135, partial [Candidatus Moranbacteria bacterium]|nr:hypothetical protein [Candidatus Moranbacteria bacterium]